MSLPPGFMDELRSRVSLAQVVGRKVSWDARKSNQGKGDMWAPCPFHQEKTASFHVDDAKGFYYCFGCHEKGDAIGFVMATENVSFIEAVRILAGEVGMQMPERDPEAQQKADRRTELADVMEQAVQWYRLQLGTGAAAAAREYLARRGLDDDAQARWEIGFAPEGGGVMGHLRQKGVATQTILGAGLAAESDRGGAPYERFRGRIVFPIRDGRGRAIALGGRAMDPNARAKYLNSPETEIFDKGRGLYNIGPARAAAGKDRPLVVAEGYMDVIALAEAGFAATVAPLGTAITEDQLRLMWRIHPEPVIALDGDGAGQRAAMRLVDLALPMLEAGQSLRFCLMPEGQDPDDLLKAQGAGAMRGLLDRAEPMVNLLWRRETEGRALDSPERRAALDKSLRAALGRIGDPGLRQHYASAIKEMRWQLFNPRKGTPARAAVRRTAAAPVPSTRASQLTSGGQRFEERLREAVILAVLLRHPALIAQFEEALERMECTDADHARIASEMIRAAGEPPEALRERLEGALGAATLEKLHVSRHLGVVPALRDPDPEQAALCLAEEFAKLAANRGASREIDEALEDVEAFADEGLTWRLGQAAEARNRALRSHREDGTEYDIAPNGARISREERSALDGLLGRIGLGDTGTGKN